jgi:phosphoserine phosphatase
MKNYGMMIGLSGAPDEVVRVLGEYFNFDLSFGTQLGEKNGFYNGRIKRNLVIKETKEAILKRIIDEHEIDLSKAFGFGDTEQDLSFLSLVGNPIVLNPNQELLSIAQKNDWMIFHNGDDIINEINKRLIEIKSE